MRQTSFAQEDATSSLRASNVVLSYGVALTPRHRDFLHMSLCGKKEEPGEKSWCMLPLGKVQRFNIAVLEEEAHKGITSQHMDCQEHWTPSMARKKLFPVTFL